MACEIIIKGDTHSGGRVNYTHPNAEKDRSGVYKKGYPVNIRDYPNNGWGYMECYPYFISVIVTDGDVADVEDMIATYFGGTSLIQSWQRQVDWSVVNSDLSIDGWRYKAEATNPGLTNLAGLTRDMIENYLNEWNATVFSASTNEVIFDSAIYEDNSQNPGALQSEGFWDFDTSSIVFNETEYDSGTGEHTVTADYSAVQALVDKPKRVEDKVTERGGSVISNTLNVITFTINRTDVRDRFKESVNTKLRDVIYRRQFHISETTFDNIVATADVNTVMHKYTDGSDRGNRDHYTKSITLAQLQSYLLNRLDESL